MRVRRAILVFALALVLGSIALASQVDLCSANSGTWVTTFENGNPVYTWAPDCWVGGELQLDLDYSGAPGGTTYFKLAGEKDNDPLVTQTVLNNSAAVWKDWHVDILNGTIDRVDLPVVHKMEADASNWNIQFVHNPGYTDGFGASWVGGTSSVENGKRLSVRFRWTPNGGGPVTIRQYPTDTGAFIPEPSSVLALTSGLLTMGIGVIRRRR